MKHRRRSLTTSVQAHAEHFLNLSQKTDSVRTRNHLVFLAIKATTFHNSGVIRRRGYAPRGAPLVYSHGNDAWARKAVSAGIASSGALFTALLDVSVNGWRFRDLFPKPGVFSNKTQRGTSFDAGTDGIPSMNLKAGAKSVGFAMAPALERPFNAHLTQRGMLRARQKVLRVLRGPRFPRSSPRCALR
jgi:hypothetical protein